MGITAMQNSAALDCVNDLKDVWAVDVEMRQAIKDAGGKLDPDSPRKYMVLIDYYGRNLVKQVGL